VMTVHPGRKGQEFMKQELKKVQELRRLFPNKNISVDGGINTKTARLAVKAGANILVANSAVFGKKEIGEAMEELKSAID
ncbi:MAG: ribulose-phosphate 3-epimerase, partial [Candidatus Woesearchaeota archaeon]|nr:ribulose-phosphate 3-epimerase [Candidatus Woesearchaeota archaeon]